MSFQKVLPILTWLPSYKKKWLKGDIVAGLTVGVMLVPQGIAYAMIAGLPPIYGLYTSLIPPIIYMLFGSSRNISIGPVAMDSLIVASGVSLLATIGTENFAALAILLAFMVGVIQLLFGVFKLGFLVNFLSKPVISGFTSGAAIIIAVGQFKNLLGFEIDTTTEFYEQVETIITSIGKTNIPNFLIGLGAMVIIIFFKKYLKKIPGTLVVVVLGILILKIFGIDKYGVLIVGAIPKGLPSFEIPTFNYEVMVELFPVAVTLAVIGFIEAFSIGKSLENVESEQKISANQEFRALGLGNIIGSFFLSFNTTSSFSRSAVNHNSGANTQLSTLFASFVIALTLLFLTPVFYYLPKAVVSAIIIVAVAGLFDYKTPLKLWKYDKIDALILFATFLITLLFGIKEGVLTGVVLSIVMIIYNSTKPHVPVLGRLPNTIMYRNIERFEEAEIDPHILIIRFDSQLNFTNSAVFKDVIINEVNKKGPELKLLIINANSLSSIDSSGVFVIKEIILYLKKRNIELYFTGIIGPVRDTLHKSLLMSDIGVDKCYLNIQSAVDSFYNKQDKKIDVNKAKYANQTNK